MRLGIAVSIVGLATAWSRPVPHDAFDYLLNNMPLVESLRRIAIGASYLRALARVLESRHPPFAAVESATIMVSAPVFRRQAGEASGRVVVLAHRAARLCETDLERRRERCGAILDPVLMLCAGSVVLLITLAVLLPIFDLLASIAI